MDKAGQRMAAPNEAILQALRDAAIEFARETRLLRRVWTADKPFDHEGVHYRAKGVWSEVKPLVVRHLGDLEIPVILYEVYRKGVAAEEKLA